MPPQQLDVAPHRSWMALLKASSVESAPLSAYLERPRRCVFHRPIIVLPLDEHYVKPPQRFREQLFLTFEFLRGFAACIKSKTGTQRQSNFFTYNNNNVNQGASESAQLRQTNSIADQ